MFSEIFAKQQGNYQHCDCGDEKLYLVFIFECFMPSGLFCLQLALLWARFRFCFNVPLIESSYSTEVLSTFEVEKKTKKPAPKKHAAVSL